MALIPKNWATFQHYKDRKPPWIKLHRGLLDDYAFLCLPLASQALAPRLWLLASEYSDGKITATLDEVSFRLHVSLNDLAEALKPLVTSGFFQDDSLLLAACKQEARLEREKEGELEKEKELEKELEGEVPRKGARSADLAFAGTVVRLNVEHFDKWTKAYSNLDLLAELTARDAWLASEDAKESDRKRWFISTAQHLANRNMQATVGTKHNQRNELFPDEIYRGLS